MNPPTALFHPAFSRLFRVYGLELGGGFKRKVRRDMKTKNTLTKETRETSDNRAELQAVAQLETVCEMVEALNKARNEDDDGAIDDAHQQIQEDPLSVEVRTDWHTLGAEDLKPTHYRILLCTGGPAVQIVGELSEHGEPETAEIQYQDWFTPWVPLRPVTDEQEASMVAYAREFYFGE